MQDAAVRTVVVCADGSLAAVTGQDAGRLHGGAVWGAQLGVAAIGRGMRCPGAPKRRNQRVDRDAPIADLITLIGWADGSSG